MIRRKARPPSVRFEQLVVGVDLVARHRAAVGDSLEVEDLGEAEARERAQPDLAEPRTANGRIDHGRRKPASSSIMFSAVRECTRSGLRIAHSKPIGPPMSCTTRWQRSISERVDRLAGPAGEARPGVVEVDGAVGEPEPREVEGHPAQSLLGEHRDHLAVQEGARGDAVQRARPARLVPARARSSSCRRPQSAARRPDGRRSRRGRPRGCSSLRLAFSIARSSHPGIRRVARGRRRSSVGPCQAARQGVKSPAHEEPAHS